MENVQEAMMVSCLRSMSGLTSMVTSLPSPTKHTVPQTLALRTAWMRASGDPEVSSVQGAP